MVGCINYMNLTTARSAVRAKEVGIRKAMGSYRGQLMIQFISESFVFTIVAVVISCIAVFFLIPSFNQLAGTSITQNFINDPFIMLILILIVVFVGLAGGSYPALRLSNLKITEVLNNSVKSGGRSSLRKILVVVQFSVSLIMIISTWVVFDQLSFMRNKDLGFNKDRIVKVLLNGEEIRNKYPVLRAKLLAYPSIEAIASSWGTPGGGNFNMSATKIETTEGEIIDKVFQNIAVDQNFMPTLEIPILTGRNFDAEISSDTSEAIIVNQELVGHMGWEQPIGKKFLFRTGKGSESKEAKVIGVIQNFHLRALHEPIEPLVIHCSENNGNMLVRISSENMSESLGFIKEIWEEVIHNKPLQYAFVEQDFNDQYLADQKRGEVFAIFSALTIIISCLGLFGLSSFTAVSKRKEIGIRKVIGASTSGIVMMMSWGFLKLVAISVLISFPIAYYVVDQWLSEFAFRSNIDVLTFVLSSLITITVTFLTVSYHSLSAASSNPSQTLREQ